MTDNTHLDPVTVVITNHIQPGRRKEFIEWQSGIAKAAGRYPGNQGTSIIKPTGDSLTYRSILRFTNHKMLAAWEESEERLEWIDKLKPLLESTSIYEKSDGIAFWFDQPDIALPKPPKYRMALVTLLAIYPLILLIPHTVNFGLSHWNINIPWYVATLVSCLITVAIMTWIVMPTMTKVFSFWLFKKK